MVGNLNIPFVYIFLTHICNDFIDNKLARAMKIPGLFFSTKSGMQKTVFLLEVNKSTVPRSRSRYILIDVAITFLSHIS